jgi:hypothetical protein
VSRGNSIENLNTYYGICELLWWNSIELFATQRCKLKYAIHKVYVNFERMSRMDETRLTMDLEAARGNWEFTKSRNSRLAKADQQKLKDAENMMLQARFGENFEVGAAGEDWEGRRLLGKKVLAKKVMEGWTV